MPKKKSTVVEKKSSTEKNSDLQLPPDNDNWSSLLFLYMRCILNFDSFNFLCRVNLEFKLLGTWTHMNFDKRMKEKTYVFAMKVFFCTFIHLLHITHKDFTEI